MKQGAAKGEVKRRRRTGYYDYNLLAAVIILICFGLVMLYSASAYEASNKFGNDMYYFGRQALISLASVGAALAISKIDYHILSKWALHLYVLALILMAMVRFSPLGVTAGGARRWLNLGIQFQPSEIAKIAVILFLPAVILKMGRQASRRKAVLVLLFLGLVQAVGAYELTDNLSTAVIIMAISVVIIFLSHPKTRPFLLALVIITAVVGGILAFLYLNVESTEDFRLSRILTWAFLYLNVESTEDFRLSRILTWFHPEDHPETGGWQVLQGLYAIGSGGFFGKGLGNSVQKLTNIPEAQNDMIFSIICEELGLFGAILLLLLFGYLLYRLFFIAQNAPDLYGTLIVSGIFAHIALQVILNVCVVLNVIPTTGVTLPFVSYGGTSVLFLMGEIGVALSVARQIRLE